MKIGELSRRTGVSTRLLRYYEQQDLVSPQRATNGYREYDEEAVDQVLHVRGLIQSGLTTRLIKILIDMEGIRGTALAAKCTRAVATVFAHDLADIEARIVCLERSRATMRKWLAAAGFDADEVRTARRS